MEEIIHICENWLCVCVCVCMRTRVYTCAVTVIALILNSKKKSWCIISGIVCICDVHKYSYNYNDV